MLRTVWRTCREEWTGEWDSVGQVKKGGQREPLLSSVRWRAVVGPVMGWRAGQGQTLWSPRGRCVDPGCEHKGSKFGTLLVNSTTL